MKRDEYLMLYREKVQVEIENSRQVFIERLMTHSDKLKKILIDNFRQIKTLMMENEKEYIMFFYFSLLKTAVLNRKYTIISQAMDSRWYLDKDMIETSFQLDFVFEPMNELWDFLLEESQKTFGKVNQYDVQQLIFSELKLHNNAIAHFLRYLLKNLEEEPEFKEIVKVPYCIVRWGEYRDTTQIVLQIDRDSKTQKQWNEALRLAEKKQEDLANSYWYDAVLKGSQCKNINMSFITFEKCHLEGFVFENTDLSEAKFLDTNLSGCSFSKCNLYGTDFRGIECENVDFQESCLKNAIFSLNQIPHLNMTPEQLQDILVEKEEQNAIL